MRKKLAYLSTILVASFCATSAQAVVTISGPSGTFAEDEITSPVGATAPCQFTRDVTFVTPTGFNQLTADISTIFDTMNPLSNIDFSSVTFNNVAFNSVVGSPNIQEVRNIFRQPLIAGATNVLRVSGTTGGNAAFSGNLNFWNMAAVPEPSTWMLMLLGMAGVGFSMRRKEKQTLRVRYT